MRENVEVLNIEPLQQNYEMQSSHMTEEKSQSQPQSKNGEKESMFSRKIYQELVEIYFDLLRDK